jgi:hypothetical protein
MIDRILLNASIRTLNPLNRMQLPPRSVGIDWSRLAVTMKSAPWQVPELELTTSTEKLSFPV